MRRFTFCITCVTIKKNKNLEVTGMAHQRNNTLDILKLLASYMVVFIHVPFYGKLGIAVNALARFAVPLFFVVSGFYSYEITRKQIKKRILHILHLLIFAVTIFVLWRVSKFLITQDTQGLAEYFARFIDVKSLLKMFLLNKPLFTAHLWYLFALLYVYIIYYFVVLWNIPQKLIFAASTLLLAIHLLLGEGLSAFGIVIPNMIMRNFLFMGIPFFGLGMLANTCQHKLQCVPNYAIVISLIIGSLEALLSRQFYGNHDLYIGSLFVLFALTVIFIKFPHVKFPPFLRSLTRCSTYIYIFHPIVSAVLIKIYPIFYLNFKSSVFLRAIHPLIVCVLATAGAFVLDIINQRLMLRQKHRVVR